MIRANQLKDIIVANRRYLHQNAESGIYLPGTVRFVMDKLTEMGLSPVQPCPTGVVAIIEGGKPGRTILLRADMDGLPMTEQGNLPFRSKTAYAHACGHDMHAAMLLGAAQLLVENRGELCGNVKLVFQSGEETFEGAKALVDAGVLANPTVGAAISMHVMLDHPPGAIQYCGGYGTFSRDAFKIVVTGKGCHGDSPHTGVDPINVAVHIYQAFQELISRETPPLEPAVLTFGQFSAGSTCNIIPETAVLQGILCTYDNGLRGELLARMREIADMTARVFCAAVELEVFSTVPANYTDPALLSEMLRYIGELDYVFRQEGRHRICSSEDFAFIAERVPSFFLLLSAKVPGNDYPHHNPHVQFNEDALPLGTAIFAQCAERWLAEHQ